MVAVVLEEKPEEKTMTKERQNCIDFVLELKEYLKEQQRKAVFEAETDKENLKILRKTLGEVNSRIADFLGSW